MNYGGAYRNTPANLLAQQEAEDLFLVENLVVNKEQRIPDIAYFRANSGNTPDTASTADAVLMHGQEFHTPYWGHLGLAGHAAEFSAAGVCVVWQYFGGQLVSDERGGRGSGACAGGLVGYVHPFDIKMDPVKRCDADAGAAAG